MSEAVGEGYKPKPTEEQQQLGKGVRITESGVAQEAGAWIESQGRKEDEEAAQRARELSLPPDLEEVLDKQRQSAKKSRGVLPVATRRSHTSGHGSFMRNEMQYEGTDDRVTPVAPHQKKK